MFGFGRKMLVSAVMLFGCNALHAIPVNAIQLKCVSISNQECRIRHEIININSNELSFYP